MVRYGIETQARLWWSLELGDDIDQEASIISFAADRTVGAVGLRSAGSTRQITGFSCASEEIHVVDRELATWRVQVYLNSHIGRSTNIQRVHD
jgi:hypothetical protein